MSFLLSITEIRPVGQPWINHNVTMALSWFNRKKKAPAGAWCSRRFQGVVDLVGEISQRIGAILHIEPFPDGIQKGKGVVV